MTALRTLAPVERPHAFKAILKGGLLAGTLDGLDAVVFFGLAFGVSPGRIFQYIASGLLGPEAFHHGWSTILLGIVLHFTVALGAATMYYGASTILPFLLKKPFLWGPVFGIGIYLFMNQIVIPVSLVPKRTESVSDLELINGILVHALFVGPSIALMASRSRRMDRKNNT